LWEIVPRLVKDEVLLESDSVQHPGVSEGSGVAPLEDPVGLVPGRLASDEKRVPLVGSVDIRPVGRDFDTRVDRGRRLGRARGRHGRRHVGRRRGRHGGRVGRRGRAGGRRRGRHGGRVGRRCRAWGRRRGRHGRRVGRRGWRGRGRRGRHGGRVGRGGRARGRAWRGHGGRHLGGGRRRRGRRDASIAVEIKRVLRSASDSAGVVDHPERGAEGRSVLVFIRCRVGGENAAATNHDPVAVENSLELPVDLLGRNAGVVVLDPVPVAVEPVAGDDEGAVEGAARGRGVDNDTWAPLGRRHGRRG